MKVSSSSQVVTVKPTRFELRQGSSPRPMRKMPPKVKRVLWATIGAVVGTYAVAMCISPHIALPARPAVPAQNGFPLLKTATATMVRDKDVADAIARSPKKSWSLEEKRELVAANRVALDQIHEALQYPYYEENAFTDITATQPYYAKFRDAARLLALAGNVAWEEGNQKEATERYLDGVAMGRRIPHHTGLLGSLVGIASEYVVRRPLWDHLEQMDEATASHTLARLELLKDERLPYHETMEEEKYSLLTSTDNALRHRVVFSSLFGNDGTRTKTLQLYANLVPRKYVVDTMGTYMDTVIAQSHKPYISDHAEPPLPGEILTRIMTPVTTLARCKYVANETGDNLMRASLALRIYHLRHGSYPEKLADLSDAKIIGEVPTDPFALPGTPLCYKRQTDGKYLLYSIGPDGVDDGGKGIINGLNNSRRFVEAQSKGDVVAGWYNY